MAHKYEILFTGINLKEVCFKVVLGLPKDSISNRRKKTINQKKYWRGSIVVDDYLTPND